MSLNSPPQRNATRYRVLLSGDEHQSAAKNARSRASVITGMEGHPWRKSSLRSRSIHCARPSEKLGTLPRKSPRSSSPLSTCPTSRRSSSPWSGGLSHDLNPTGFCANRDRPLAHGRRAQRPLRDRRRRNGRAASDCGGRHQCVEDLSLPAPTRDDSDPDTLAHLHLHCRGSRSVPPVVSRKTPAAGP